MNFAARHETNWESLVKMRCSNLTGGIYQNPVGSTAGPLSTRRPTMLDDEKWLRTRQSAKHLLAAVVFNESSTASLEGGG